MTTWRRNQHGLKNSIDMYRTFNGVRFNQWTTEQFDGQADMYRRHGIRARKRGDEIYIHPDDEAKAARLDRQR
jgi:hypothetical protein